MEEFRVAFPGEGWVTLYAKDAKDAASWFMHKCVDRRDPLKSNGKYVMVCDKTGEQTRWEIEIELHVVVHAHPSK
jgi:uncharacterized protein YhfF